MIKASIFRGFFCLKLQRKASIVAPYLAPIVFLTVVNMTEGGNMKGRVSMKELIVYGALISGMTYSQVLYAASEEESEVSPEVRDLAERELTIDDEFEKFQGGGFFMPPFPRAKHFFGYERPRDLFKDFKERVESGSESDVEVCAGQDGDTVDGAIKLSFSCDDGSFSYSCYADILSGGYSVDIPDEVLGKSCIITVEKIEASDDETDVETDGVETTEEVELSEDSTVSVDV